MLNIRLFALLGWVVEFFIVKGSIKKKKNGFENIFICFGKFEVEGDYEFDGSKSISVCGQSEIFHINRR